MRNDKKEPGMTRGFPVYDTGTGMTKREQGSYNGRDRFQTCPYSVSTGFQR
jgi:hypothetical protein